MKTILIGLFLIVGFNAAALEVDVLEFGSGKRGEIIKLEEAKMKIQDTIGVYKKGMSKAQKDQLTADLKALRKCKFQTPCKEEISNRTVNK